MWKPSKRTWTIVGVLLVIVLIGAIAEFGELAVNSLGLLQGNGGGSSRQGDDESTWITRGDLPGKVHNPNLGEQNQIRVEWGEVTEGQYGTLLLKGKLLIESADGKSRKPVDWAQGVRVVLARSSKDRPDWSKRHDEKDSVWCDCIAIRNGEFDAEINLDRMQRTIGKTEPHQVAVTLGRRGLFNVISFSNTVSVLPQTVGAIKIPGPRPLSPTLQLINGSPSIRTDQYDPIGLVRAVNHLHGLGKEKTVLALREYAKLCVWRHPRFEEPEPANLDLADPQAIFLIVRLLFVPDAKQEDANAREAFQFAMYPHPYTDEEKAWPLFPVGLQDDIPFLIGTGPVFSSGPPPDPVRAIEWAEKYGRIREKPLRPGDNPLLAMEKLLDGKKPIPLGHLAKTALRTEAWHAVRHLLKPIQPTSRYGSYVIYDIDKDWEGHKEMALKLKIHWDEQKQEYVAQ